MFCDFFNRNILPALDKNAKKHRAITFS